MSQKDVAERFCGFDFCGFDFYGFDFYGFDFYGFDAWVCAWLVLMRVVSDREGWMKFSWTMLVDRMMAVLRKHAGFAQACRFCSSMPVLLKHAGFAQACWFSASGCRLGL